MPDLFSPYFVKDITLRNRIVMSPMTMYRAVEGLLDDYHICYPGVQRVVSRALLVNKRRSRRMGGLQPVVLECGVILRLPGMQGELL